jgi:hypothetical protein
MHMHMYKVRLQAQAVLQDKAAKIGIAVVRQLVVALAVCGL